MATTPLLELPVMENDEVNGHVTHNESLRLLDFYGNRIIQQMDVSDVPGSPQNGQAWIIYALGTWPSDSLGKAPALNDIAHRYDDKWYYYTPKAEFQVWDVATLYYYRFDGGGWTQVLFGAAPPQDQVVPAYGQFMAVTTPVTQDLANGVPEPVATFDDISPLKNLTAEFVVGQNANEGKFTAQAAATGIFEVAAVLAVEFSAKVIGIASIWINGAPSPVRSVLDFSSKDVAAGNFVIGGLTSDLLENNYVELYIESSGGASTVTYHSANFYMTHEDDA